MMVNDGSDSMAMESLSVTWNPISIIGNGVVVDPWALLDEIKEVKSKGVNVDENNLIISESASLILPFHKRWMK